MDIEHMDRDGCLARIIGEMRGEIERLREDVERLEKENESLRDVPVVEPIEEDEDINHCAYCGGLISKTFRGKYKYCSQNCADKATMNRSCKNCGRKIIHDIRNWEFCGTYCENEWNNLMESEMEERDG